MTPDINREEATAPSESWLEQERKRAAIAQAYEDSGETVEEREKRQERERRGETEPPREERGWNGGDN